MKKLFWLIILILGIGCSVCVFHIVSPNASYHFDNHYSFEPGVPAYNTIVFDNIALKPGAYEIKLQYSTDTDAANICTLKDGSVFTGGLLTNGEHLYSALNQTGYMAWLYESTKELTVVVSYSGSGMLEIEGLTINETNLLWTKMLVILLFFGLLALVFKMYYRYKEQHTISENTKKIFFFCTLIGFIASIPYLHDGIISGADLTYHLQRIEGVKDGLLSGQFPVRFEPKWVFGHGYANGIFYCNALLYFPALLRMAGFTVTTSYSLYCIVLNFATAWIAWYCFRQIFEDDTLGLICSGMYTLSIFRIYKLVITSAVGEGSAYTFFPLIVYGLYSIFAADSKNRRCKRPWIPIAIGYTGLIFTHVLTCEITAFLTVIICLVFIRKVFRPDIFLELAKGALAALGLSLWYLVPFLDYYITQNVHIKNISARTIQDRGILLPQLAFQFWRSGVNTPLGDNGMQYSHPVGVGLIPVLGLLIFAVMHFSNSYSSKKDRLLPTAVTAALFGSLLLLFSLNIFPWDKIQNINSVTASLVSSLQFPNRFLGWGTACLTLVGGFVLYHFKNLESKDARPIFFYMGVLVVVIGIATSYIHLMDSIDKEQEYFYLYNEESMGFGYISGAEYLIEGTDLNLLTFEKPTAEDGIEIISYAKNGLRADMECRNSGSDMKYAELPILMYKGYQASDSATGQKLEINDGFNHKLRVCLPAQYEGTVRIDFVEPLYWRIAEIVSLFTLIGLCAVTALRRRKSNA